MRNDIHRPSLLDPAEYTFMACFYQGASDEMHRCYREDMREYERVVEANPAFQGNFVEKGTCDHCGASFNHGVLFLHVPTGHLVHIGHICADNTVGLPSHAVKVRKDAERAQREENERRARMEATAPWRAENADVVAYLAAAEVQEAAWREAEKPTTLKAPHAFINDMVHSLNKWGSLYPRQAEAVRKFIANDAERAARPEAPAEVEPTTPLPTGRREITGTVLSHKWQESMYGDTHKMLVKEADGNKVWGTVPGSIESACMRTDDNGNRISADLKGMTVTLTAQVERSRDDEHFGFYKRPTGGRIVGQA